MHSENSSFHSSIESDLKSVVVEALGQVAQHGLPGAHHLYVTFATGFSGVELPDHLHEKFPEEMTIVLQHQFWELVVEEDRFLVTLSFNDVPEQLVIPFRAIKSFADPSVNFGLQLKFEGDGEIAGSSPATVGEAEEIIGINLETEANSKPIKEPEDGANVVTLDTFRKK